MTPKALSSEEMEEERKFFSKAGPVGARGRRLFAHISALEAENAALLAILRDAVMAMNHVCDTLNDMDAVNPEEDAPAMAAVERVTEAMERIDAGDHPGAALLEWHAKALVRARNEGLEQAAQHAGHDEELAERIRAMMEPEQ